MQYSLRYRFKCLFRLFQHTVSVMMTVCLCVSLSAQTQTAGTSGQIKTLGEVIIPGGDSCEVPSPPIDLTPLQNLTICSGDSTQLEVFGMGSIRWYTSATGGSIIDSGNLLETPPLSITTTFYAEAYTCDSSFRTPVTVNVNAPLPLSILKNPIAPYHCEGTSVTLTASGGTSYSWNGGISNGIPFDVTASQTYVVTASDSNGCKSSQSISLTVVSKPSVTLNVQDVDCHGFSSGSIQSTVTSGNYPYTYIWNTGSASDSLSNLTAGIYTITVLDNMGCTAIGHDTVSEPTQPVSVVVAGLVNEVCHGDSIGVISAAASGGVGTYQYTWSNGSVSNIAFDLPAGSYTVTTTDANGCTATINASITEPNAINVQVSATDIDCYGQGTGALSLVVSNAVGTLTYEWSNGVFSSSQNTLLAGDYEVTVTDANGCTGTGAATLTEPSAPLELAIADVADIQCNGEQTGSMSVFANGGTEPFTYTWSNGLTGSVVNSLKAGNYTVSVTDANGCVQIIDTVLHQPESAIGLELDTVKHIRCFGDSTGGTIVHATGGTEPHMYEWNTGATTGTLNSLPAGSYTVTITDANGCTMEKTINVEQPKNELRTVMSSSPVLCFEGNTGKAAITSVGGVQPYTYQWSNASTEPVNSNLAKGVYQVTITDANGCQQFDSVVIEQPDQLQIVTALSHVRCHGEKSGEAIAAGAGGVGVYDYAWSNGKKADLASGLRAATYTVTVTDSNGCVTERSVTIREPAPLVSTVQTTLDTGECIGQASIAPTGGSQPYSYLWSDRQGQISNVATHLCTGTYCVTVTDVNGCEMDSCDIVIENNKKGPPADFGFFVFYPNPNNGTFFIEYSHPDPLAYADITVFDMLGKPVWWGKVSVGRNPVNMGSQASGTYVIQFQSVRGILHQKVVIR